MCSFFMFVVFRIRVSVCFKFTKKVKGKKKYMVKYLHCVMPIYLLGFGLGRERLPMEAHISQLNIVINKCSSNSSSNLPPLFTDKKSGC